MNERQYSRRGGIVGPVILIGLGTIFLLNNLGILDWSVWAIILRLWPILLVAAGLDLILGRRSVWGALLALALTVAVLVGALWLSSVDAGPERAGRVEEVVQPLEDVDQAYVAIEPGVGTLRVEGSTGSRKLVEGTASVGRSERLDQDFSIQGATGVFRLRTQSTSFGPFPLGWTGQRLWDLRLTSRVPLRLETDLGLGLTDLDLGSLTVESVDVDHGLGQVVLVLPEDGRFEARVDGAMGQTIIVIPRSLAARIRLDTGITARQIAEDYVCDGDVCTSPEYEDAENRVDLNLGQAVGSVVVRH
ncbi:MAG: DUF5668 domain-containing protein [Anaerolineae bacterium]|jgi:hypothetical protein